jgi:hypothetical protein
MAHTPPKTLDLSERGEGENHLDYRSSKEFSKRSEKKTLKKVHAVSPDIGSYFRV